MYAQVEVSIGTFHLCLVICHFKVVNFVANVDVSFHDFRKNCACLPNRPSVVYLDLRGTDCSYFIQVIVRW